MNRSMFDVIIIGGGAAGLFAAISLPDYLRVLLLEKEEELGRKIAATGNGRCNLSNVDLSMQHYHGANPWFAEAALHGFGSQDLIKHLRRLGLFVRVEEGRIYPYSMQAKTVRQTLLQALAQTKVQVRTGDAVRSIRRRGQSQATSVSGRGGCFTIDTASGKNYTAEQVLVCCGGMATPKLGSDGSGYPLLEMLGHSLVTPVPSLVQLIGKPVHKRLSGTRVQAQITLEPPIHMAHLEPRVDKGEILFTDYGLSGIPVLNVSGFASKALRKTKGVNAGIDFFPEVQRADIEGYLFERRNLYPTLAADDWGSGFLPVLLSQTLLNEVLGKQKTQTFKLGQLTNKQLLELAATVKNWSFQVTDVKGFDFAQVTAGGIDTTEFSPETMESVLQPGLYAAGEILDIDGDCGGYNLHWAWASAATAVAAITKRAEAAG